MKKLCCALLLACATFPGPVADLDKMLDGLSILSAKSGLREKAVLGPFVVASYRPAIEIVLARNPHYWKLDETGRRLPYLDSVHLDIQQNPEIELSRFRKGEVQIVDNLSAELFDRVSRESPALARDAGSAMDSEFLWFNQVSSAPLPEYKKAWFRSANFRRAIGESVNRDDICRIVLRGHGRAAAGPFSPANRFWFNSNLKPYPFDPSAALKRLQQDGFRLKDGALLDAKGNPVEFSVITNAGNKTRERMAAMVQQDLRFIGVRLNIVTLDFPSLIERITRTFNYEACMLGLTNIDLDPNAQMNVWMSSADNHQWNPRQKSPETPWEAEIDRLMLAQAAGVSRDKRKALFDRVQEIVWEQAPFIYLIHKNALSAVSSDLRNVKLSVLSPQTVWNIERIYRRQ